MARANPEEDAMPASGLEVFGPELYERLRSHFGREAEALEDVEAASPSLLSRFMGELREIAYDRDKERIKRYLEFYLRVDEALDAAGLLSPKHQPVRAPRTFTTPYGDSIGLVEE